MILFIIIFSLLLFAFKYWLLKSNIYKFKSSNILRHFFPARARIMFSLILILGLSSCLKEDEKIAPHEQGDINTVQIAIEFPYKYQVFYNCEQNKIISTNSRYDWDLAFESNGSHIRLNIAKAMFASNMGNVNFDAVLNLNNVVWLWDNANGNLDSLALNGKFENPQNVFIINRGFGANGNHLGYYKVLFITETDTNFTFKYAKIDGTDMNTYTILKDKNTNFTSFSFDDGGKTVAIEPLKNNWDLEFTNWQHYFTNLPLPFVITQCVSNIYNGVRIADVNEGTFNSTTLEDTIKYVFTSLQNEIGYDWKIRNSQDNSFEITTNKFFIVKTKIGFFYKLRFIDFYNESGEKGYPTFEIQKL